ncbi:hypothetical protein DFH09DRAFT_1318760 [Mycena vulgaris]|nr:hypothetical protein DFH09DRAFT_1318760 [Mycena vulgaris]
MDSSLRLTGVAGLGAWLNHEYCPFDLSGLRILLILGNNEALRWPKLSAGLATVEVLDLRVNAGHTPIDLSPFRGLTLMRIWSQSQRGWPKELDTLAPSNRVRTLVLAGSFFDIAAEALASALARLPLHRSPAIELEMDPSEYARIAPALHRLGFTTTFSSADHACDWFEIRSFSHFRRFWASARVVEVVFDERHVVQDWASGYPKYQCPVGYFVSGYAIRGVKLSTVLCAQASQMLGTSGRTVWFDQGDNRADTLGEDFAPGQFKGSCAGDEYVGGVAFTTRLFNNGAPAALLCAL